MKFYYISLIALLSAVFVGCTGINSEVNVPEDEDKLDSEIVSEVVPEVEDVKESETPKFETVEEYMMEIQNSELDEFEVVSKPEGYGPILFGGQPTVFNLENNAADFIILVKTDVEGNLVDDFPFYLERTAMENDCISENIGKDLSKCPMVKNWFGPFTGKVYDWVQ